MLTGQLPGFVVDGELLLTVRVEAVPFCECGCNSRSGGQQAGEQQELGGSSSDCAPAGLGPLSSNGTLLSGPLLR